MGSNGLRLILIFLFGVLNVKSIQDDVIISPTGCQNQTMVTMTCIAEFNNVTGKDMEASCKEHINGTVQVDGKDVDANTTVSINDEAKGCQIVITANIDLGSPTNVNVSCLATYQNIIKTHTSNLSLCCPEYTTPFPCRITQHTVAIGNNAKLDCNQGNPSEKIRWTKSLEEQNGIYINGFTKKDFLYYNNTPSKDVHYILNAEKGDDGFYICFDFKTRRVIQQFNLTVKGEDLGSNKTDGDEPNSTESPGTPAIYIVLIVISLLINVVCLAGCAAACDCKKRTPKQGAQTQEPSCSSQKRPLDVSAEEAVVVNCDDRWSQSLPTIHESESSDPSSSPASQRTMRRTTLVLDSWI